MHIYSGSYFFADWDNNIPLEHRLLIAQLAVQQHVEGKEPEQVYTFPDFTATISTAGKHAGTGGIFGQVYTAVVEADYASNKPAKLSLIIDARLHDDPYASRN